MSVRSQATGLGRVRNDAVWGQIRGLFLAALLLFGVTIVLGFVNALTTGPLPRWQLLTHLHAGALGWITLMTIGIALWVFTGDREVSARYVRGTRLLAWLATLAFTGYVASFGLAFSQGGDALVLLPIFGGVAMVLIWAAAGYALTQLRHQPVVTSVHVLVAAGLLIASLGALMGFLLGLQDATGTGIGAIQAHAPPMLFYLLAIAGAVVEWTTADGTDEEWTWAGLAQAAVLVVGAVVPPVAFLLDLERLAPLLLLMLGLFLVLFLVRMARRAFTANPFRTRVDSWIFFAALWLVVTVVLFPAELILAPDPPAWLLPVLAHFAFLGMMSNALVGVVIARTKAPAGLDAWTEFAAMWILNLGIVAFAATKIVSDARHGAFLMGIGALLAAGLLIYRLLERPLIESRRGPAANEGI